MARGPQRLFIKQFSENYMLLVTSQEYHREIVVCFEAFKQPRNDLAREKQQNKNDLARDKSTSQK